ncbi:hypothetical protein [Solirubrobacter soli]|uniref:hypothetical protein n=1 Tax=Solirubrobacter soli TaxID=363832 RepID=UPI0004255D16|nr:hypothetical protein [Solirubrobacter soli]
MNDAFDDLERDLRAAVRARRRRRVPTAPLLGALVVLALGGGGAVAATQIGGDAHVERDGTTLAERAAEAVKRVPGCRPAHGRVANTGPVLPAITRALPALRGRDMTLAMGSGIHVRVRVRNGPGPIAKADPGACLDARRAKVRALSAGRPVEVRTAAERAVVRMRDTAPGVQMLSVDVRLPPGEGGFGTGFRLRPGDAVPTGVIDTSGRLSLGIADPRAVRVRVGSRTAPVVDGLYVLAARGTVTELAADGSVIRRTSASGRRTSGP